MKMFLSAVLCAVLAATPAFAGDTKDLQSQKQKLSYALGMNMGGSLKQNSIDVDVDILVKAIRDSLTGGKMLMTDQESKDTIMALQKELQTKHEEQQKEQAKAAGEKNKKEGAAFLAANKIKGGVVTLPSGLQYKVLDEGMGRAPKAEDTVTVKYRGTLIDGTEFDSSYKRGKPATFALNSVIKGWSEALQLMKEGAKWQLFIPGDLAYGEQGTPGGPIGPNAVLIFDVELVAVRAAPAE